MVRNDRQEGASCTNLNNQRVKRITARVVTVSAALRSVAELRYVF
jgi:hypothetical protein